MARQGPAYLSNLTFVKMERPGQRSPRMTEFSSPAVALSIIQTSALISTSENDRGQKPDSGNKMRKVKRRKIVRLKRLTGVALVTVFWLVSVLPEGCGFVKNATFDIPR